MTQTRFRWLRRAWDFFTGYSETQAPVAPPAPPARQAPPVPSMATLRPPQPTAPLGEVAAFYAIGDTGLAVLSIEHFEAAPQANQEAVLRVRVSNVGPDTQEFAQVMLYWHAGADCEGQAIARQRALAIPPMAAGGSGVFTTRLHVPLTVEGEVSVLLVPTDGDGLAWEPKGERLVLRRFVAGVPALLEAA